MTDFQQFCTNFSPLTHEALDELTRAVTVKTYRKGQYLVKKNHTCEYLFFVHEGLLKLFFTDNNKQFVMRFFAEHVMFSVFDSYIPQSPSKFDLVALEKTVVTCLHHKTMEDLCRNHHSIETFFRKLLSVATIKMTKRIREMLESDARERYNIFVKENKAIIQRICLADIANYVGITQQSLSRIRASK